MNLVSFVQKGIFRFRTLYSKLLSIFKNLFWRISGMKIGYGTSLPSVKVTWPHQVQLGNSCRIESGVYFKYDGIWQKGPSIKVGNNVFIGRNVEFNIKGGIRIGDDTLIASDVKFIDHDHGMSIDCKMRKQQCPTTSIEIGSDVWIGVNAVILKGVRIGAGSVIAAGAVVTRSVANNEIWGGVPARKIGERI